MFRRSRSEGILELEHGLPGFRGEEDVSETEHLLSSHGDVIIERSRGYTVHSLLLAPLLAIATDVEQILENREFRGWLELRGKPLGDIRGSGRRLLRLAECTT
jgi:hypothetical protein